MIVTFLTDPTIERAPAGRYRLVTPLVVSVDHDTWTVPVGFTFDGASVPPLFWPLISHPLAPSSLRPAVLHDWHCATRTLRSSQVHAIFHAALLADGCAPLRAWLMGKAVAWLGPTWRDAVAKPAL